MNTGKIILNFAAVKLVASGMGAALESHGEIPDQYLPIASGLIKFLLAGESDRNWSYDANLNEHAFMLVALAALRGCLLTRSRDDAERTELLDAIALMEDYIKARAQLLRLRSVN